MFAIIDFVLDILGGIVNILNTRFFDDVNITFLQVLLVSIIIKYIIKFLFGGFKEVDSSTNYLSGMVYKNTISNNNRKGQVIDIMSGNFIYKTSDGHYGGFSKETNIHSDGSVSKVISHVDF